MEMEGSLYERLVSTQEAMLTQLQMMHMSQTNMQQKMSNERLSEQGPVMQTTFADGQSLSGPEPLPDHGTLNQPPPGTMAQPQPTGTLYQQPEEKDTFGNRLTHSVPLDDIKEEVVNNRSYLMGGESLQQHHTDIRQKFQMGTLNAIGGTTETAVGLGAFLAPGGLIASTAIGLGAGAAVGYGVDKMVDGAKEAMVYQRILEDKGYKAFNVFEGRNDFGGVGMTLDQQQEMSSFLRDMAPEKFLKNDELAKILDGSLDGKLLKSSTDMESFKKKFSDIVDSVKEVAVVMNSSLEEATKMLGELESRGITATKATMLTSQVKVNASLQGISTEKGFAEALQTADMLTQGSGMSAEKAMSSAGAMQYVTSSLYEQYKETDVERYNFIKNNGGESALAAKATDALYNGLSNANLDVLVSQAGFAAVVDEDGNVRLDREKVEAMARGELGDAQQVSDASNINIQKLTNAQKEQFKNSLPELLKNDLSLPDNAAILRSVIDFQKATTGRTPEAVLQQLGVASGTTEASILIDQIYNMTGENANNFAALATREGIAGIERVNAPGIFSRIRAGWNQNVTNPLGDIGQFVSDEVGDIGLSLQKSFSSIDSSKGVRSENLISPEDYEEQMFEGRDSFVARYNASLEETFALSEETERLLEKDEKMANQRRGTQRRNGRIQADGGLSEADIEKLQVDFRANASDGMSMQRFEEMFERAKDRELSLGEIAELRETQGKGSDYEQYRTDVLLGFATGEMEEGDIDTSKIASDKEIEEYNDLTKAGKGKSTIATFEKEIKEKTDAIVKEQKTALESSYKAAQKLDLSPEEAAALDKAIRRKDLEGVQAVTQDKDVIAGVQRALSKDSEVASVRETTNLFSTLVDNSLAKSDSVGKSVGLLISSKVMESDQAKSLFADALELSDEINEGVKNKKLTTDEMLQKTEIMDDHFAAAFSSLSDEEVTKYAQEIADLNQEDDYTMDSFIKDGVIDREKIVNALPQIIVDGSKKGADGVSPTNKGEKELGEHQEALGGFLETVTKETAMIKEAQKSLKNGVPYQYTSISGY